MAANKRFIAGAVCPRCAAMDTVYVLVKNDRNTRACTDCGFEEQANFEQSPRELPTRVNQTRDNTVVEIQNIKIIDTKKGN